MLLPACMLVVSLISIAIPSTSGLVAAVGPTIIPLMVRAGFHPAIAAASVVGSITLAYLSPGVSHNAFIAKLADITIMDFIGRWMPVTVGATLASIVLMVIVCVVYRDFRREGFLRLTALRASSLICRKTQHSLCHCSASSGRDPRLRKHLGAAAQDVGGYRHADRRYLCYRRHSYQPGRSD